MQVVVYAFERNAAINGQPDCEWTQNRFVDCEELDGLQVEHHMASDLTEDKRLTTASTGKGTLSAWALTGRD